MKTTHALLILVFFLSAGLLNAQTGYSDAGSRSNAMGNASVTFEDVYAAQNNQAAMGFVEEMAAGASMQNYFLVDGGINSYHGAFVLPYKNSGTFGISLNYKGDPTFNQSKIGVGYGKKLTDELGIGIQLDYVGTTTTEVGSGAAFTFDIGVIYKPVKSITIGAKAFNPIRAKTGLEAEQELPALINVGVAYAPSEKILIAAEAEEEINEVLRGKFGAEYHVIEELFIRGGYITNPSMFTCGVGLDIKNLKLDISAQFHQQLGLSPGVGLSYKF